MYTYPMTQPMSFKDQVFTSVAIVLIPVPVGLNMWLENRTPHGSHLSGIPFMLGVVGAVIAWAALAGIFLAARVKHPMAGQSMAIGSIIFLIYGVVSTGPAIVRHINMALDDSPRVEQTVTVLANSTLGGNGRGTHRVTLAHWQPDGESFTVDGSARVGNQISIYVHEGFLGFPWVELPRDAELNERYRLID